MNLFIIGNSFSQDATRYLPQLAAESGHELYIGRAETGGCSLQRHWEHVQAAERGEPEGGLYFGQSLREKLQAGPWDRVIFQQASMASSDIGSYRPYARLLLDFIRELCPGAEVALHQTWVYRCDSPHWGEVGDGNRASDPEEMWRLSRDAYRAIADELGLALLPTGDAFRAADNDPQWRYRVDAQFDFAQPPFPNLPDQAHSLHAGYYWNDDAKLALDPKHASPAGAYLGSLMWHGFLFDASPEDIVFTPPEVPAAFAAYLRSVADGTLREVCVTSP